MGLCIHPKPGPSNFRKDQAAAAVEGLETSSSQSKNVHPLLRPARILSSKISVRVLRTAYSTDHCAFVSQGFTQYRSLMVLCVFHARFAMTMHWRLEFAMSEARQIISTAHVFQDFMEMALEMALAADCVTLGNILSDQCVSLVLKIVSHPRDLSISVLVNATKDSLAWREGPVLLVSVVRTRAFLGLFLVKPVSHTARRHTHLRDHRIVRATLAILVTLPSVLCVLPESTDLEDQVRASIAGLAT